MGRATLAVPAAVRVQQAVKGNCTHAWLDMGRQRWGV